MLHSGITLDGDFATYSHWHHLGCAPGVKCQELVLLYFYLHTSFSADIGKKDKKRIGDYMPFSVVPEVWVQS